MFDFSTCLVLAQEGAAPGNPMMVFTPLVIMLGLFYFLVMGPQNRERRRHEEMLKTLKKDDKVLTRGGIVGTVANISPDGQKVTVKVDDNTRIPIRRNYIAALLNEEDKKADRGEKSDKAKSEAAAKS